MIKYYQILLFTILPFFAFSQTSDFWSLTEGDVQSDNRQIVPAKYKVFHLNNAAMKANLDRLDGDEVLAFTIPLANGQEEVFDVQYDPIMHPDLAAKFPNIRTYKIINQNDRSEWGRIDYTEKGFHGMIFSKLGTIYIDPFATDTPNHYTVYFKRDFVTDKASTHSCGVEVASEDYGMDEGEVSLNHSNRGGGATLELRTYRLAINATGEYTAYHGGQASDAMSAMTTTMNRVNAVYERDMAIRLEFVANNDFIIYTNAASDPFTNGNTGAMINESHNNCNSVIGTANYDIGHVFGTNSGGLAGLASVCKTNQKGRGVTGSGAPIGDPFDIDYVCHEMGHQFGANHTFNNCGGNENPSTAMEPGSGSTIMAYAGLCGSNNVQSNSDDHFHVVSLEEMLAYTTSGVAYNCAEKTATGNIGPVTVVRPSGFAIPKSTPFELIATSNDPDNDDLTYCWEQYNVGPTANLGSPSGDSPSFRSLSPISEPVRVFPNLPSIVEETFSTGEVTPTYGRNMEFKVTVRDNNSNGGMVDIQSVAFTVDGNSGPFRVFYPNNTVDFWNANDPTFVEWVVNGTDQAPVNCQEVDIFLSTDGGYTYPITIATNVPNNGYYAFNAPDIITDQARVKIKASDNIFFDISNRDFEITWSTSSSDLEDDLDISVYPNPAKDVLNVEMKDIQDNNLQIEIYDMRGVLVAKRNVANTIDQIDISNLASGMYRVSIKGESIEWNDKIVVLK